MTVDTSREAVEALIARARDAEKYDLLQTFFPQAKPSDRLGTVMVDTLAALLDERDRLAANRDAWVSDAMTSTTELEQRIRDLETDTQAQALTIRAVTRRAERAEAEVAELRRQHDGVQREWAHRGKRLREVANERDEALRSNKNLRRISNANGDWSEKYQAALRRAECAEEQLQAIREVVTGWNGFTGLTREVLAILADTDERGEQ